MTDESQVPNEEMESGESVSSQEEPRLGDDLEIEDEQASQVKGGWIIRPSDRS